MSMLVDRVTKTFLHLVSLKANESISTTSTAYSSGDGEMQLTQKVTLIRADNRNIKWKGNISSAKYSNNLPFAFFGWGAKFLVALTRSSITEQLKI